MHTAVVVTLVAQLLYLSFVAWSSLQIYSSLRETPWAAGKSIRSTDTWFSLLQPLSSSWSPRYSDCQSKPALVAQGSMQANQVWRCLSIAENSLLRCLLWWSWARKSCSRPIWRCAIHAQNPSDQRFTHVFRVSRDSYSSQIVCLYRELG